MQQKFLEPVPQQRARPFQIRGAILQEPIQLRLDRLTSPAQALRGLAQLNHRRRGRMQDLTGAILCQNGITGKPTAGSKAGAVHWLALGLRLRLHEDVALAAKLDPPRPPPRSPGGRHADAALRSMGLRPRLHADAALRLFGTPGLAPGDYLLEKAVRPMCRGFGESGVAAVAYSSQPRTRRINRVARGHNAFPE